MSRSHPALNSAGVPRRQVGFWTEFNDWWRGQLNILGKRPSSDAIQRWYNENSTRIWADDERPSVKETRAHAKCLRSTKQVREYFRRYRAARKDGKHGRGGSDSDEDDGISDEDAYSQDGSEQGTFEQQHSQRQRPASHQPPPAIESGARAGNSARYPAQQQQAGAFAMHPSMAAQRSLSWQSASASGGAHLARQGSQLSPGSIPPQAHVPHSGDPLTLAGGPRVGSYTASSMQGYGMGPADFAAPAMPRRPGSSGPYYPGSEWHAAGASAFGHGPQRQMSLPAQYNPAAAGADVPSNYRSAGVMQGGRPPRPPYPSANAPQGHGGWQPAYGAAAGAAGSAGPHGYGSRQSLGTSSMGYGGSGYAYPGSGSQPHQSEGKVKGGSAGSGVGQQQQQQGSILGKRPTQQEGDPDQDQEPLLMRRRRNQYGDAPAMPGGGGGGGGGGASSQADQAGLAGLGISASGSASGSLPSGEIMYSPRGHQRIMGYGSSSASDPHALLTSQQLHAYMASAQSAIASGWQAGAPPGGSGSGRIPPQHSYEPSYPASMYGMYGPSLHRQSSGSAVGPLGSHSLQSQAPTLPMPAQSPRNSKQQPSNSPRNQQAAAYGGAFSWQHHMPPTSGAATGHEGDEEAQMWGEMPLLPGAVGSGTNKRRTSNATAAGRDAWAAAAAAGAMHAPYDNSMVRSGMHAPGHGYSPRMSSGSDMEAWPYGSSAAAMAGTSGGGGGGGSGRPGWEAWDQRQPPGGKAASGATRHETGKSEGAALKSEPQPQQQQHHQQGGRRPSSKQPDTAAAGFGTDSHDDPLGMYQHQYGQHHQLQQHAQAGQQVQGRGGAMQRSGRGGPGVMSAGTTAMTPNSEGRSTFALGGDGDTIGGAGAGGGSLMSGSPTHAPTVTTAAAVFGSLPASGGGSSSDAVGGGPGPGSGPNTTANTSSAQVHARHSMMLPAELHVHIPNPLPLTIPVNASTTDISPSSAFIGPFSPTAFGLPLSSLAALPGLPPSQQVSPLASPLAWTNGPACGGGGGGGGNSGGQGGGGGATGLLYMPFPSSSGLVQLPSPMAIPNFDSMSDLQDLLATFASTGPNGGGGGGGGLPQLDIGGSQHDKLQLLAQLELAAAGADMAAIMGPPGAQHQHQNQFAAFARTSMSGGPAGSGGSSAMPLGLGGHPSQQQQQQQQQQAGQGQAAHQQSQPGSRRGSSGSSDSGPGAAGAAAAATTASGRGGADSGVPGHLAASSKNNEPNQTTTAAQEGCGGGAGGGGGVKGGDDGLASFLESVGRLFSGAGAGAGAVTGPKASVLAEQSLASEGGGDDDGAIDEEGADISAVVRVRPEAAAAGGKAL